MSKPYHDPDTLLKLHWEENLSLREIGRKFDVSHKTISYRFDKHDLDRRGVGGEQRYASFGLAHPNSDSSGYEWWRLKQNRENIRVSVHRLLAVSEYGLDKIRGKIIHHKNGISWDNRPENIIPMENSEHSKMHHKQNDLNTEALET